MKIAREKEGRLTDYENKIGMLVCEAERLNGLLKQKLEEIEYYKGRCLKVELLSGENEKLKQDLRNNQQSLEMKGREAD